MRYSLIEIVIKIVIVKIEVPAIVIEGIVSEF
jgi:hypothetical protein